MATGFYTKLVNDFIQDNEDLRTDFDRVAIRIVEEDGWREKYSISRPFAKCERSVLTQKMVK